jgi:hypothetical protein
MRDRAPSYGVQNRCPPTPTMNSLLSRGHTKDIRRMDSQDSWASDTHSPPPQLDHIQASEGVGVLDSEVDVLASFVGGGEEEEPPSPTQASSGSMPELNLPNQSPQSKKKKKK